MHVHLRTGAFAAIHLVGPTIPVGPALIHDSHAAASTVTQLPHRRATNHPTTTAFMVNGQSRGSVAVAPPNNGAMNGTPLKAIVKNADRYAPQAAMIPTGRNSTRAPSIRGVEE